MSSNLQKAEHLVRVAAESVSKARAKVEAVKAKIGDADADADSFERLAGDLEAAEATLRSRQAAEVAALEGLERARVAAGQAERERACAELAQLRGEIEELDSRIGAKVAKAIDGALEELARLHQLVNKANGLVAVAQPGETASAHGCRFLGFALSRSNLLRAVTVLSERGTL